MADKTLSLVHAGLAGPSAACLAAWLRANTTCLALDLSINRLGPDGVDLIADALHENRTCSSLSIAGNACVAWGGEPPETRPEPPHRLVSLLRCNSCLTSLDLRSNGLWDAGCKAIADALTASARTRSCALLSLDLGDNRAATCAARALSRLLRHPHSRLRSLGLGWSLLRGDAADLLADLDQARAACTHCIPDPRISFHMRCTAL